MRVFFSHKQSSLFSVLICLTLLFVAGQLGLVIAHLKATDLMDSLVSASIGLQLLHPVILLPIFVFIVLQTVAYGLFIAWIWFVTVSLGQLLQFTKAKTYYLGIFIWLVAVLALLNLNNYLYPASFFAKQLLQVSFIRLHNVSILLCLLTGLLIATVCAYVSCFRFKRQRWLGGLLLSLVVFCFALNGYAEVLSGLRVLRSLIHPTPVALAEAEQAKPNIIIIGLDSLRPDFTGFYGNPVIHTPNIDRFLHGAVTFKQAYTPLARTFPSWMTVLTSKYPKHNHARNNLVDPTLVIPNDTLAKELHQAGYETVYATDEKRFSNITEAYGFDRILGPGMGVNDFLLGSLMDFPMTNLLVNLPLSQFLFPYNYGNRAATITYEPDKFLQLIEAGLAQRSDKPMFLAVHFCLTHWPFTWARDGNTSNYMPAQYRNSVEAVDRQLGVLMQQLKDSGLLKNSMVVLISDHGTALGLPGDRVINAKNYQGEQKKLKMIQVSKFSYAPDNSTNFKTDYSINTSYGQGTNVLSLTQYHTLLAFRRFGEQMPAGVVNDKHALLDVAPTILDYLGLAPMQQIDGVSLRDYLADPTLIKNTDNALFMETGDSMAEIETNHIYIEKVVKRQIGIYRINAENGLLFMDRNAEHAIIINKQLAILSGDWLLARFPMRKDHKLVKAIVKGKIEMHNSWDFVPPHYILANLKTGNWTIGLSDDAFAKASPAPDLLKKLKAFYGEEL